MKAFKHIGLFKSTLIGLLVACSCTGSFAQNGLSDDLLRLKAASDSNNKSHAAEKLYLQLDKPYYAVGDTLWFKAYLFNSPTAALSAKSGILYVDVTNDSSTYIQQYRLPVKNGVSWGNISLKDFPAGNYTLRAYTTWMRNFGEDCFYYKRFIIADNQEQTWLANLQNSTTMVDGKLQAKVKLQLTDMNKVSMTDRPLQLEVMAGNHHLYKQQVQTDHNGLLDISFTVPDKAIGLNLVASDKQGNKIVIPIVLNRADKTDIQFLPEGGSLVAGLPAHIGFKAIGEDGKGVDISGIITDHSQQQVAAFKSLHNGMGSFELEVKPNEKYSAKVNLPGGLVKEYPLPVIKNSGTVLNVINPADRDSITLSLAATNDLAQAGGSYFLIGKSRGIICYAAVLNFKDGASIRRNIAKRLFPSGITHFILMDTKQHPLNERLVYIEHNDNLGIELATDMPAYAPHDSVAMHITIRDSSGAPVAGNFSLAVTDDAQVKTDSLNNENIITRMLLTGDLKGYIEQPGYYLQVKDQKVWQALDNLLLTQGWVNYDWHTDKEQPVYIAEEEFAVKGRVINILDKSVKNTHVTLLSKSPLIVRDTLTDKDGRFVFHHFPRIDTPAFVLKAVNKRDKSFNVDIVMDDVKSPAFTIPQGAPVVPWYIGSDTALLNSAKNSRIRIEQAYLEPGSHMLKEVTIKAQKTIKGSQNLNGPGNADLTLDEADMEKAGKKTLLDMLIEKIPGFRTGNIRSYLTRFYIQDKMFSDLSVLNSYPGQNFPWFFAGDKAIKFIIDGIPFGSNIKIADLGSPNIIDITGYLKLMKASDVRGIELNNINKYSGTYFEKYMISDWPVDWAFKISSTTFAFIEITTRAGRGPTVESTPGIYSYKPMALSLPTQFYKPRYAVKDTTKHLPDLRSTIDWEPNITTDKDGKATVSFYAADRQTTYTLIMEGTDGNGNLGYKRQKISIVKPKEAKSK